MTRHSTARHFLEGLVDVGVDFIFANPDTDHVFLIEEIARWDKGRPVSSYQDGAMTLDRRAGETQEAMTVAIAATTVLRTSAPSPT
jgi:hypothetical protein